MYLDHRLSSGPPNSDVPFISRALSVGFCFLDFGGLGALVPDLPGDPVNDFFFLSLPIAMCGLVTVAIFPEAVAPAVACSSISLIRIILFNFHIAVN